MRVCRPINVMRGLLGEQSSICILWITQLVYHDGVSIPNHQIDATIQNHFAFDLKWRAKKIDFQKKKKSRTKEKDVQKRKTPPKK